MQVFNILTELDRLCLHGYPYSQRYMRMEEDTAYTWPELVQGYAQQVQDACLLAAYGACGATFPHKHLIPLDFLLIPG